MKSSTKLSILGIFSVSLILTIFLTISPAAAPPSLEKISLGDSTIRIQSTSPANPILDIQLIENTDQCFVNCHAILRFHPYEDITLPSSPNSEFRWDFIKAKPSMLGLSSYSFQILKNTSYNVTTPVYENTSYSCYNNQTQQNETCWRMEQTGSNEETRYKQEYQPFSFWGETLQAGKDYYIKLEGKKYAQLGANNIDWVPTVKGIELAEWAPWDGNWTCKAPINISTASTTTVKDYTILINVSYATHNCSDTAQADFGDFRFVNGSKNTELDYWIGYNASSDYANIWVEIDQNITTANYTIYMYYGNSTVDTTSDILNAFIIGDNFSTDTITSGKWLDPDGKFSVAGGHLTVNEPGGPVEHLTHAANLTVNHSIEYRGLTNVSNGGFPGGDNRWWGSFLADENPMSATWNLGYIPEGYVSEDRLTPDAEAGADFGSVTQNYDVWYVYRYNIWTNASGSQLNLSLWNTTTDSNYVGSYSRNGGTDHDGYVFGFGATYSKVEWDWVFIRHFNYGDEPTYGIEAEEPYETTPPSFSNPDKDPDPPNEDQDVMVNITITETETNIDSVWINFTGATINWTVTTNISNEYYFTITSGNYTAHDTVTYTWYANDTLGNLNSSEQSFIVANQIPSAPTLSKPANNSGVALGSPVPEFNWSVTDEDDEDNESVITYTFEIYYLNNTPYNQTTIPNNYTTPTLPTTFDQVYHWRVQANDSYNVSAWSVNYTFQYANWTIIFNLTDSYTGEQIDTSSPQKHFDISCDNGFSIIDVNNPYTATDAFAPGTWECTFSGLAEYFDETQNITADNDTTIEVPMSEAKQMTIEEHTWLEWLYNCWHSGTCKDLLEAINLTTVQINETVNDIWNQYRRTDQSIVTTEDIINKTVSATSNLTINYSIDVPIKEGYTFGETSGEIRLDYLPIRISYWFLNYTDNKTCYPQGNYSVATAEPYCQPLTVYTVGQINSTIDFIVDLRPSLPSGNYTIVRNIEIDPEQVWINYGMEVIGVVEVLEANNRPSVSLRNTGTFPGFEPASTAGAVSSVTGWSIGNAGSVIAIISVIAVLGIAGYFLLTKKRNQYQGYSYNPF